MSALGRTLWDGILRNEPWPARILQPLLLFAGVGVILALVGSRLPTISIFKLAAFAMGTSLAGLSGAFYAYHLNFIGAESFGFVESITVLSMVVCGGTGSVPGVIIAAALLSVLPAWFQVIGEEYIEKPMTA